MVAEWEGVTLSLFYMNMRKKPRYLLSFSSRFVIFMTPRALTPTYSNAI